MALDPANVQAFQSHGSGNIGTVADKTILRGRFPITQKSNLAYVKARFDGSGDQGTATLTMFVDHRLGHANVASIFDFTELEWETVGFDSATGTKKRIDWLLKADEAHRYVYWPGDALVFEWADPGTTDWGIEIGLAPT